MVGIVGESGSGKTVSMLAVMRLIRDPNAVIEGHVLHRGRDLLKVSKSEIRSVRGAEIAMVFQDPMTSLTPVYTVGWQIAEQVRAHEPMSAKRARQSSSWRRSASRIRSAAPMTFRTSSPADAPARDDRDGALVNPSP